jgi:hypothetical protein
MNLFTINMACLFLEITEVFYTDQNVEKITSLARKLGLLEEQVQEKISFRRKG